MLIADLQHFIGIDFVDDAPAPARRLAEHLTAVVRAATAARRPEGRRSALRCRRRRGRVPCSGRILAAVSGDPLMVHWGCTACEDHGVISGWQGTPYDLTPRTEGRAPIGWW